jgi:hypothetical protein
MSADVFIVDCPKCRALPSCPCTKPDGSVRTPHQARERALRDLDARYMKSTFLGRQYPEAIFFAPDGEAQDEDCVVGPFCQHCGNPFSMHGPGSRCPNSILHPLFPNPMCRCHGLQARVPR